MLTVDIFLNILIIELDLPVHLHQVFYCFFSGEGIPLRMPSLSPTMVEGKIVKWLKQEGDRIEPGDVLCDIETDKAVISFEVDEEGTLAKILVRFYALLAIILLKY